MLELTKMVANCVKQRHDFEQELSALYPTLSTNIYAQRHLSLIIEYRNAIGDDKYSWFCSVWDNWFPVNVER